MIVDPRNGDIENDHSSPMSRSLLAIAGSLLVEISPLKLIGAVFGIIIAPAIVLGLAPLAASIWIGGMSGRFSAMDGLWSIVIVLGLLALAYKALRPLAWVIETSFWSMNALLVQPAYALCREALGQAADRRIANGRARRRAVVAAAAGVLAAVLALGLATAIWPVTRWTGAPADFIVPTRLFKPALANALFVIAAYAAVASIVWGIADAFMPQLQDLETFAEPLPGAAIHRIAQLSDVHVVGERYGFRIESGRQGPRGNARFHAALDALQSVHERAPVDHVLFSGDMTDAGRAPEWAEFLDALALRPDLRRKALILPGNHDLNIIDPVNPARLELPFTPARRLRKVRALSVMAALQGDKVRIVDLANARMGPTLNEALAPHLADLKHFADAGPFLASARIDRLWQQCFPQVLPPDGSAPGVILLDSNATAHFSFTNALGLLSTQDEAAIAVAIRAWPGATWVLGLHHHLLEYPTRTRVLSERIGTALINGSWFVRKLQPAGARMIAMHGHRHKDWIGRCGSLKIISAPSPVMTTNAAPGYFYIHSLQTQAGELRLLQPERIEAPAPAEPDGQPVSAMARSGMDGRLA